MRSLPAALWGDLDNDAHSVLVPLVEIGLSTPIYRALWNKAVTFDGDTYTPDIFEFGQVGGALRPQSPTMQFRIQNVRHPSTDAERPWSTVLASEDVNGVVISVRVVMTSQLSDTTAQIDETGWVVRGAALRGNFCEMEIGPPYDLARLVVPSMSLRSPWCAWEYRDRFCRSESTLASCPKSYAGCFARHAQSALRFSQYPFDTDMRRTG